MGDLHVKVISTQKQLNDFTRYLLKEYTRTRAHAL
ncbi:MAG: hypothetical protein ACJA0X_001720 [Cyclobacteriaceae bacterium]|jgi:hypothetical protein